MIITPLSTDQGVNFTMSAIDTCLQSSYVQNITVVSMICTLDVSTTSNELTSLGKYFQKLENYLIEKCHSEITYTILRIPPVYYCDTSFFASKFIELLDTKNVYLSLLLASNMKYKHYFTTLDDIAKGIAWILTHHRKEKSRIYNLFSTKVCDEEVLPIISELWEQQLSYQPVSLLLLLFLLFLLF